MGSNINYICNVCSNTRTIEGEERPKCCGKEMTKQEQFEDSCDCNSPCDDCTTG